MTLDRVFVTDWQLAADFLHRRNTERLVSQLFFSLNSVAFLLHNRNSGQDDVISRGHPHSAATKTWITYLRPEAHRANIAAVH